MVDKQNKREISESPDSQVEPPSVRREPDSDGVPRQPDSGRVGCPQDFDPQVDALWQAITSSPRRRPVRRSLKEDREGRENITRGNLDE